ncbi:glycosyltransferase [Paenibacillus sp. MWE-103]|uniref:Glycosyltransferase n=1 Tax=Paenibacillus artemisiicola TaxID=1172618 RepID=A0ABS3WG08_9BACL|nr:TPR domain-containing glycosyltransferase [Paenibacillus artemisiicola]MBO7747240.1 glycosyltransferase [Paenibacillus artemisiicola]
MVLLSVCMIVKNEEKVLTRCLDSIRSLADEIIVIDTGSTDRTKEIARSYTDRVYDFQWINDFAAARNEGIRRATSRWVLVMDADEYFPPAEADKMRRFLENETPVKGIVYAVNIVNLMGESEAKSTSMNTAEVARLFPNHHNVFYTRPIHEQLCSLDGTALQFMLAQGSLFHTGYLKENLDAKDKLNRNASIFTELKNKKGFSAYDYYTIGNEKAVKGDYASAIYYYERALKKGEKLSGSSWYCRCVISLIQSFLTLRRVNDAWTVVETKLIRWNAYPDYHSLKGSIFFYLGLFQEAKQSYTEAYQAAESMAKKSDVFWLDSPAHASTFPFRTLADIANQENDADKHIYYLTKLLIQNPYDYNALSQLIEVLLVTQPTDAIIKLLCEIGDADDLKYQLFLFKVALALGVRELASYIRDKMEDSWSELDAFSRLSYALLVQDEAMFSAAFDGIAAAGPSNQDELPVLCAVAAAAWDNPAYVERLPRPEDPDIAAGYDLYEHIVKGEAVDANAQVYLFLTKCYLYRFYDPYDRFVERYSNADVTNLLANFFYGKKQFEVALQYYSILLRNGELSATSLENLAHYHLSREYIEDGLEFLESTLNQRPEFIHLYTFYLRYCPDADKKKAFLRQHADRISHFRKVPAFARLLNA